MIETTRVLLEAGSEKGKKTGRNSLRILIDTTQEFSLMIFSCKEDVAEDCEVYLELVEMFLEHEVNDGLSNCMLSVITAAARHIQMCGSIADASYEHSDSL